MDVKVYRYPWTYNGNAGFFRQKEVYLFVCHSATGADIEDRQEKF